MDSKKSEVLKKLKSAIPKNPEIFREKSNFPEVLCKPKLLPLKSITIKKLEELEKEFEKNNNAPPS